MDDNLLSQEGYDWKAAKEILLRRKRIEVPPKLDAFLLENGVTLKAVIIASQDGQFAQAQIVIDLID